ncbi:MAG TPA: hypothetical protein V6C76_04960 [Drouetiella sp.]
MQNDAPRERIDHREDNTKEQIQPERLEAVRSALTTGGGEYKSVFKDQSNDENEKKVVRLGFPRSDQVVDRTVMRDGRPDAGDRVAALSDAKAVKDYGATLMDAGFTASEAAQISKGTFDRFSAIKDGGADHLVGTPAEQVARVNAALKDILEKKGVVNGRLEDGQVDPNKPEDRKNTAKDLAMRTLDPEKYSVQGQHFTCGLESRNKQLLESGDVAKVAEQTASVMNRGYADIQEANGKTRRVHVSAASIAADSESARPYSANYHGIEGKRGMAGQVWDALAGQAMADLKSERKGEATSADGIDKASRVYLAAHADSLGANTKTGEGLFKRTASGFNLLEDNPGATPWDLAHLNLAMGGRDDAVAVHRSLVGSDRPPAGYPQDLRLATFGSANELRSITAKHAAETGQSLQIIVDAPYLPGGGADGHGLHAMNASLNKDGSFRFDNNWGAKDDIGALTDDQVDRATNPNRWNSANRPTADTVLRPGDGRNPNETVDEANKRREDDARRKQEEDEHKKQEEKRKQDEKEAESKRKEAEELKAKADKEIKTLYANQLKMRQYWAEADRLEQERQRNPNFSGYVQPPELAV